MTIKNILPNCSRLGTKITEIRSFISFAGHRSIEYRKMNGKNEKK